MASFGHNLVSSFAKRARGLAFAAGAMALAVHASALAQGFVQIHIDENKLFMQNIPYLAVGGTLLVCEGETVDKNTFIGVPDPWDYLCGFTLPKHGISDIIRFFPKPLTGTTLIQMASDLDADAATTPADTTPLPGGFGGPLTAVTEVLGPSGFIEYDAGLAPGFPGFFMLPGGVTPLYLIQSDCQPAPEHLATCGVINQIPPQCGDPDGTCGFLFVPESSSWTYLIGAAVALALVRRRNPDQLPKR